MDEINELIAEAKNGNGEAFEKICKKEEVRAVVKSTRIELTDASNKLLYLVLRHPNYLMVRLLRAAMILYYRRR